MTWWLARPPIGAFYAVVRLVGDLFVASRRLVTSVPQAIRMDRMRIRMPWPTLRWPVQWYHDVPYALTMYSTLRFPSDTLTHYTNSKNELIVERPPNILFTIFLRFTGILFTKVNVRLSNRCLQSSLRIGWLFVVTNRPIRRSLRFDITPCMFL